MPPVTLSSPNDAFEGFWTSNLPGNDLSVAATNGRPTLLIPNLTRFSIQDYLTLQFKDPVLQRYNLIALDLPGWPGTNTPLLRQQADKYDEWVAAAIIGDFCLTMNLKDVHFLGITSWAGKILPRLAALFPSIPKSISNSCVIADAPMTEELTEGIAGTLDQWTHATCMEELEELVQGELYMWFHDDVPLDPRIFDDFLTNWRGQRIHTSALLFGMTYFTTGMTKEAAALVQCPLLVVQGDINPHFTPESARLFAAHYPNACSSVHILHGAPPAISSSSEFAPALHHLVVSHIEHSVLVSPTTSTFNGFSSTSGSNAQLAPISIQERRAVGMRDAMKRCISIAPEWLKKDLKSRDPLSAMSFSQRSPEQLAEMHERWYDRWLEMEKEECINFGK
ncbi:hypothetical protein DL93DRAFT_2157356 [Clavulina sp. PMI_390]|nr:hypothetical protein DL93DRAFT_2157356 [Clavulina sp. PMI_390]